MDDSTLASHAMRVIAGAGLWSMYEDAPAFNAALSAMLATPLRGGR
jgi:hypothetical protein